ncbi:cytosolic carboxypeptidase 6 isoform X4 [Mauremys mutica]|uniref:cytosolic carboxypeptidase 6 isoform X4 n=1 Tax=Mauremys mutica TaxID=74926 RepID=UPI001D163EE4|nr:cytosolic carboxypeptidase 6 isoform X4 [Mauremys mutica]XP_044884004.1 cytosolic carboxypeptidase 6 isoform X4 [Mauremys mutica]
MRSLSRTDQTINPQLVQWIISTVMFYHVHPSPIWANKGNLGRVDHITEFEYDLFIRPDTCNPRFRVWFNFTVENVKESQRVIFNIVNFSKTKSLYRDGMTPMVKSTSRPKWQRLPPKNVYYYRCPDHRKNYVMSFAFCFDREDDIFQFAYCYPYTYTRLRHYLDNLQRRNMDYFYRELLGLSVQQRQLDLLTITNPVNLRSGAEQKVVFITARVHPGETPSSFVCQGIIDFLVSQHPIAKVLRDHLVFKIAPMLNPDGVYLGNYRCSLMGFDLNRHWVDPSPWAHPTLHGVKQLIVQMYNNPKISLEFYIDIHAHSTMMNGFMYGNIFEEEERFQRQAIFPKLLCQNAEDFSFSSTSFNRDAVKAGTGRRFLGGLLDHSSYCYTLEVSFYSYILGGTTSTVPYTEEAYMKLGRNVARTFLDYYRLNTISERPLAPIPNTRTPASFSAQDRPVLGMNQGCVVCRTPAPFVAELGRKEKMPPFKCATRRGPGNSHAGRKLEKRSQTNPTEHSHSS